MVQQQQKKFKVYEKISNPFNYSFSFKQDLNCRISSLKEKKLTRKECGRPWKIMKARKQKKGTKVGFTIQTRFWIDSKK